MFDIFDIFKMELGAVSGSGMENLCIVAGHDGSKWYGYDIGLGIGSADPDETNDGQKFYAYLWDDLGNFFFKFGNSGDEPISGITSIFIKTPQYIKGRIAQWDDTVKAYIFVDLELATKMIDEYNAGTTDFCIYMGIEKGLVLDYHYDYVGTGEELVFATITSPTQPQFDTPNGGTVKSVDNGDGTWDVIYSVDCSWLKSNPGREDWTKIVVKNTTYLTNMYELFAGCVNAEIVFEVSVDVSNVTDVSYLFAGCDYAGENFDISHLEFVSVVDALATFTVMDYVKTIKMPVIFMPTGDVRGLYHNNPNLICIDKLDTTNATYKSDMFTGCDNLQQPDAAAQTDLTDSDGASWSSAAPCP